jgi:hypothetical protein
MRNTMVKSVFRYLYFLRSYRHVSHYPLESNMAAYKIEPVNACNSFIMCQNVFTFSDYR